jgi:dTDP-4-dehydrorhamnose reductase
VKKIYVAGAGGMLGQAVRRQYPDTELRCTDIDTNESWLSYLDFRDSDRYRRDVRDFKPDALFHLGAHTDLEFCELNVDDAYATNAMAVKNAVFIANELEIPLLYVSTAGIFDGRKDEYDEWDVPNPLGHYARSKYLGERFVVEHAHQYLVCRAGWMMGGGPMKDKKFVHKVMAQLKAGRSKIHAVGDKLGSPTYTHDFAANTKILLESECRGLYNMTGLGETSRLDVAREMVRILGLTDAVEVVEVDSSFFGQEYFAIRPRSERLINSKLELQGLNVMRDWRIALDEYLTTDYCSYL